MFVGLSDVKVNAYTKSQNILFWNKFESWILSLVNRDTCFIPQTRYLT